MTYVIAVAGKGGVGKTTFAALAVRHLCDVTGEVVLAVDADPNSNLGEKLGTPPGKTLGDIREEILAKGDEQPKGVSKQEHIDYQIKLALREGNGFDLLTMGRQEGPGCYCYVNNLLRTIMDSLADRYKYVVIDNEAGMEHLSRRTTRRSDVLFVLHDGSKASLEASRRISALADEMKIKIGRKALVCNLISAGFETSSIPELPGFDAAYGIRRSGKIQAKMVETESLMEIPKTDPAFSDVARVVDAERKRN
jgi:CO dehydrogenase maturation factor